MLEDPVTKEKREKVAGGGVEGLIDMFNVMEPAEREKLLQNVAEKDPRLVELIRQQMFTFENLATIHAKSLQALLREVPEEKMALALRGASEEILSAFATQLSKRAGEALREAIEDQGPQRKADIEKAQKEIIGIARRLESEGKMVLADASQKGGEYV